MELQGLLGWIEAWKNTCGNKERKEGRVKTRRRRRRRRQKEGNGYANIQLQIRPKRSAAHWSLNRRKKRSISFLRSPLCASCSIHSLGIIRTEKLSTPQTGLLEPPSLKHRSAFISLHLAPLSPLPTSSILLFPSH